MSRKSNAIPVEADAEQDPKKGAEQKAGKKLGTIARILRTAWALVSLRAAVIMQEVRDYIRNLVKAFVFLVFAAMVLFGFWLLLNVLGVLALHDFATFSYFLSVAVVAGIDLCIAIVFMLLARRLLKKEYFALARKLVRDAVGIFK